MRRCGDSYFCNTTRTRVFRVGYLDRIQAVADQATRILRSDASSNERLACCLQAVTTQQTKAELAALVRNREVNRSTAVQLIPFTRTIRPSPSTKSRSRAATICFAVSKCRGIEPLVTSSIPFCASNRYRAFVPPPYPRKSAQFMGTQAKLCSTDSTVRQSNSSSKSVAYCTDLLCAALKEKW